MADYRRQEFHNTMKACSYCGKENDDDAITCCGCGTDEFKNKDTDTTAKPNPDSAPAALEFMTPTPQEMELDLVTLMKCRTLMDADLIVAQLESTGIYAFIPDQFLMQNIAFNLNTYGYVRIQVSPKDFEAAKEFLQASTPEA